MIFGYNVGVFNTATDPIATVLDWGDDAYTFIIIG